MSARITLRRLNVIDKAMVFELLRDLKVMAFLGPRRALSEVEAEQWFQTELLTPSRYVVALEETNELIGFCGLKIIDDINDFGYFFRKAFWGKGYASEACQLTIKKLSLEFDVSTFQVFIDQDNHASLVLAKKLKWIKLKELIKDGEQGSYFQITG